MLNNSNSMFLKFFGDLDRSLAKSNSFLHFDKKHLKSALKIV